MINKRTGRHYKKKWVKVFRKIIPIAEYADLWGSGKVRITVEIPWSWIRERAKNKEIQK